MVMYPASDFVDYHPIILSLNFVKGCSGRGLVNMSVTWSSVLVW
jgi:hypothetical protein